MLMVHDFRCLARAIRVRHSFCRQLLVAIRLHRSFIHAFSRSHSTLASLHYQFPLTLSEALLQKAYLGRLEIFQRYPAGSLEVQWRESLACESEKVVEEWGASFVVCKYLSFCEPRSYFCSEGAFNYNLASFCALERGSVAQKCYLE